MTGLLFIAILAAFYVAWNIGANDVANAVGTSVGSGALTLRRAVLIAAIFEFAGAFFLGTNVSETLEAGIVDHNLFSDDKMDYVFGMLASLFACGVWLQFATYYGWPVSTTHSIVGAVFGFGLILGGVKAVYWEEMGSIAISWILSPILGGILAYFIFTIIRAKILYHINPISQAKRVTPYLVFAVFGVLALIIFWNGLRNLDLHFNIFEVILLSLAIGLFFAFISSFLVKKIQEPLHRPRAHNPQVEISLKKAEKHLQRIEALTLDDIQDRVKKMLEDVQKLSHEVGASQEMQYSEYQTVEKIFVYLQIVVACFMAFAHGSNDVANAIGPLSAIFNIVQGRSVASESVPVWLLILGGIGIVVGLATWGWRVIETVGRKITELTPSRGFSAGFAAATTIVLASKLGMPISTTHVLVGAVLGVGFARGIEAINLNTIRDIMISWIVTVPAGAILSVIFFFILKFLFSF